MKRFIYLFIGLIILTGCGIYSENNPSNNQTESNYSAPETTSNTFQIKLIVDEQEISIEESELKIEEDDSLLEVMKNNFEVKESNGFIESINGFSQDPSLDKWWLFTINGDFSDVGAMDYYPDPEDEIVFILESLS